MVQNTLNYMQKYCFLLALAVFVGLINITELHGQATSNMPKPIKDILDNQLKAWNTGNLEQFMVGYWRSDSLLFMGKSGINYGYANTLANYQKSYPNTAAMGHLAFDIRKTEPLGPKHYFVVGRWHLSRNEMPDLQGVFSLIFRKLKGKWYIVADHSS
jgi:ketosteroid isomerase-like protein